MNEEDKSEPQSYDEITIQDTTTLRIGGREVGHPVHNSVLRVPKPYYIKTDRHGSPEPCPVAAQIEAFLLGLGVRLPSVEQAQRLKALAERANRDRDESQRELVDARHELAQACSYARELEQRIERSGLRLSKKTRDGRPYCMRAGDDPLPID